MKVQMVQLGPPFFPWYPSQEKGGERVLRKERASCCTKCTLARLNAAKTRCAS